MLDFPKAVILGVPFSKLNMNDTVDWLTEAIHTGYPHQIITANPIMVMAAVNDPDYLKMMQRVDMIVPDGTGIVWAASYMENAVAERVPGFDLMHCLFQNGEHYRWRVFLLGASPEVMSEAAARLKRQYPLIQWVGARDGYFSADEDRKVIAQIREAAPDILCVGRSAAGQEPWIDRYKHELNVPLMMGVGGSFDVVSGKLKRAPAVFQKLRIEWFYRLLQEPWRYKRMLDLPRFVVKVIVQKRQNSRSSLS